MKYESSDWSIQVNEFPKFNECCLTRTKLLEILAIQHEIHRSFSWPYSIKKGGKKIIRTKKATIVIKRRKEFYYE